jgi:hypothetical protein
MMPWMHCAHRQRMMPCATPYLLLFSLSPSILHTRFWAQQHGPAVADALPRPRGVTGASDGPQARQGRQGHPRATVPEAGGAG